MVGPTLKGLPNMAPELPIIGWLVSVFREV